MVANVLERCQFHHDMAPAIHRPCLLDCIPFIASTQINSRSIFECLPAGGLGLPVCLRCAQWTATHLTLVGMLLPCPVMGDLPAEALRRQTYETCCRKRSLERKLDSVHQSICLSSAPSTICFPHEYQILRIRNVDIYPYIHASGVEGHTRIPNSLFPNMSITRTPNAPLIHWVTTMITHMTEPASLTLLPSTLSQPRCGLRGYRTTV